MTVLKEDTAEPDPVGMADTDAQHYRNDLHRYLMRRLHNREDAQDLAQEAYLRYLQLPDVGVVRKPSGYLFRIAVNLIYEWRLRRDRSAVMYDSELAERRSAGWADGTANVYEQLTTQQELTAILEQIPLTYRRVLIMSKCEGLSTAQIAENLDVTPETVIKYIARATAHARRARWSEEPRA